MWKKKQFKKDEGEIFERFLRRFRILKGFRMKDQERVVVEGEMKGDELKKE